MLGPANLALSQLKIALKPAAGYEEQLYCSSAAHTEPAIILLKGVNSGVVTTSAADAAILATSQQELVVVLDGDLQTGASVVVTVTGTDMFAAPYTGVATIAPPSYAQLTENNFPRGFAVDALPSLAAKCAVISSISVVCDAAAGASNVKLRIIGLPSFDVAPGAKGEYKLINDKVRLQYTPRVPGAHAVQSGRDMSKYVKRGEIPAGSVQITAKVGTLADGLIRLNGQRVTALIREVKEGAVETSRTYLLGTIISADVKAGESVEDVTAESVSGLFETDCVLIAH